MGNAEQGLGWIGAGDDNLWDSFHNEQGLDVIASEDVPSGLQRGIHKMWRDAGLDGGTKTLGALWQELATEGCMELLRKWQASEDTDVIAADRVLRAATPRDEFGMAVDHMAAAYTSRSDGSRMGVKMVIIIPGPIYLEDNGEPDEDFLHNACETWGFDHGDFACLGAATAARKRGASVDVTERVADVTDYLRRKVWLIRALAEATTKPLAKSALEQASEVLYGHRD